MKCPFCGNLETQVKDSRPSDDVTAIRRRRFCSECGARFTTFERVELRELQVKKVNGKVEPFERNKVVKALRLALRKRPFDEERIEKITSNIVRQLENLGDIEITSSQIGEAIMATLAELDSVAYVRFASVYRDFSEAKDFTRFLGEINKKG
ncbi:MAG: transcriptional regulator NrdR [Alphaproteobacteria bacterium]|jgi:transcriptional repressor NrdR|nr:transcriptional repressor NrdR [Thalassospira sp.]MCE2964216.1 transcriptional regulator NrdR [Alphaproteobacteria bacterium]